MFRTQEDLDLALLQFMMECNEGRSASPGVDVSTGYKETSTRNLPSLRNSIDDQPPRLLSSISTGKTSKASRGGSTFRVQAETPLS
jgi:hypothetical protein